MAMDITLVMPTMDTMDTHMPTMDMLTMARDLLMPSQRPMLMLSMDTMVMEPTSVMPTMDTDTTDTHMPTMDLLTMARDLLMPSQRLMLMLSMDTMVMDITSVMPTMDTDTTDTHMPMVTDMPTADTTDTHTLTDGESKMLTKS